ncbi:MAG: peptidylprolyl isomerase [Pseudomonadota bacterium]
MSKLFTACAIAFAFVFAAITTSTVAAAKENLVLEINAGGSTQKVVIRLRPDLAPKHVERAKKLASEGFYDGIVFHRVIPGFMAQTGDPTGTGRGGSKYPDLPAEFTNAPFKRGTVGAARTANPNSANSQFFICFGDGCSHLAGQYTVWGEVVSGMDAVDEIKAGEGRGGLVASPDRIEKAYIEQAAS